MSQKFKSEIELQALNNATTDTDKFLVSDSGVVKYRTGAQVLSDIGGQAALTNPVTGTGTTNFLSKFTGSETLGNSQIFDNGTNVGIGTTNPTGKLHIYANESNSNLGSELLTSSGWTTTDWTGDFTTGFTHTTGNTSILSNTLPAVTNNYYYISLTVTGRTAGYVTVSFGGVSYSLISSNRVLAFKAVSTANLTIVPTSDFNGTIVLSVKVVTTYNPTIRITNTYNQANLELRSNSNALSTSMGRGAGQRNYNGNTTFIGYNAGGNNITGTANTAIGSNTLASSVDANYITAVGNGALTSLNPIGGNRYITAIGGNIGNPSANSMQGDTLIGWNNALVRTTGVNIIAIGYMADRYSTGGNNVSIGNRTNFPTSTSSFCVGVGHDTNIMTSGNYTISLGHRAGRYIANKSTAITNNSNSIFIGYNAGPLADSSTNEIVIGHNATGLGSNSVVLGNDSITTTALKGNVGIGTTSPGSLLHMVGTSPELRIASSDGQTTRLGLYEDTTGTQHGGYIQYVGGGDTLRLGIVNSGTSTDVITIKDNFNVGIGTTAPSSKLDVYGTISLNGYDALKYNTAKQGLYAGHLAGNDTLRSNAFGIYSLGSNTGTYSNGFGNNSLQYNTGANSNGFGYSALLYNTGTGSNGFGNNALIGNTGTYSNGFGNSALRGNTGNYSNGFGNLTLLNNSGSNNTALGNEAGYESTSLTGSNNTFIGSNASYGAATNISNATAVGANVTLTDSDTVILGNNANVGIGTTSPSSKLQVNGDLTVGDDSTVGSFINVIAAGASQDAGIRFGSESNTDLRAAIYTNTTTSDLHFDVTETTRMLINSATGNVGIGTTSPDTKLDIQASGTTQTSILGRGLDSNFRLTTRQDVSTNTDGSVIGEIGIDYITTRNTAVRFHRGGSTTGGFISFTTNDGSEKMRVTPTGNIGIGTTTPSYPLHVSGSVSNISIYATNDIVAFSDQSVKTNIRPIENALERVVQSRGVLYDRTDSKNKDNIGFIAQELEVAFPELVVTNEDGTKAVKYQNTVAVLFEAIKEQQKQIEELKQIVNGFTN